MSETTKDLNEENDQVNLLSGEDYILFNNLKGGITVWINCDQEMQVTIDTQEFQKVARDLFPKLEIVVLLKLLNRGEYVYTDKLSCRPLRSSVDLTNIPVTPGLGAVMNVKNSQKSLQITPYGINFY